MEAGEPGWAVTQSRCDCFCKDASPAKLVDSLHATSSVIWLNATWCAGYAQEGGGVRTAYVTADDSGTVLVTAGLPPMLIACVVQFLNMTTL